ncbi:hypothetical protein HZA56_19005 [Candidatus Poribacteria bacterium]|nr:hypothetical protein [Candidatus Poribacteria bacterium]
MDGSEERFYYASMDYLNDDERAEMLEQCWKYDRKLIHEKYLDLAKRLKERRADGICLVSV